MSHHYEIPIEVGDLAEYTTGPVDPAYIGVVLVEPLDEGLWVYAKVKRGEDFETFADWARQRVDRFQEHGPEPDGWFRQSDGRFHLWARLVELPPLD